MIPNEHFETGKWIGFLPKNVWIPFYLFGIEQQIQILYANYTIKR